MRVSTKNTTQINFKPTVLGKIGLSLLKYQYLYLSHFE